MLLGSIALTGPASPMDLSLHCALSHVMPETYANRFLALAEECLEEAERARSPVDKEAWLKLAEEWMQLARLAKERGS